MTVRNAIVIAVRPFVIQGQLTEILYKFTVEIPLRRDIIRACKSVSLCDISYRPDRFQTVCMDFPFFGNLINIRCINSWDVLISTPIHYYILTHRIQNIGSGIVIHRSPGYKFIQIHVA